MPHESFPTPENDAEKQPDPIEIGAGKISLTQKEVEAHREVERRRKIMERVEYEKREKAVQKRKEEKDREGVQGALENILDKLQEKESRKSQEKPDKQ